MSGDLTHEHVSLERWLSGGQAWACSPGMRRPTSQSPPLGSAGSGGRQRCRWACRRSGWVRAEGRRAARAGARGHPARQWLMALRTTRERGTCGEAQTEGEAFSGGALRVCTQISHTRVCVCRVCAHVRARLSVWRLTQVSVQAGTQNLFSFRSPGLFCDPMDCSPPVSSVHGILHTRTLEWVAILQGIFPHPGIEPRSLPQCRQILYRLNNQGIPL